MPGDFESTGGIDPAAFAAEMFPPSAPASGGGAPSAGTDENVSSPSQPAPASPPTPASTPAADAGMSQAAWDAMPKSWRREMEAEWKGMTPGARKYVHERETQATTGISQYKQGADKWNQVTGPFAEIIRDNPDVNPAEILATLAQNHLAMVRATPAERAQHAIALARGYGVDLTPREARAAVAAADAQAATPTPQSAPQEGFSPSQIKALQEMLAPVLAPVRQTTEFVNRQIADAATAEVDKFFSDPKNEFANDVIDDILSIVKSGQAKGLPEAYELAIVRNPEVKARYFAKLAKEFTPPPAAASKLPNVKSTATPVSRGKPTTMDDTMAEVLSKHYPSGS